jgi:hypothetical protein
MKRILSLAIVLAFFAPSTAFAFDTPLLTWERGRDQQVVLGGGAETANWQVRLEGEGISPLLFEKSSKNQAGYVVYSINVPSDIPTGAYTVVATGTGSTRTVVAVVAMVQAKTKTATSSLLDLTQIVALFAFLTTLLSTLRLTKYSRLPFTSTQFENAESIESDESFIKKLEKSPLRIRLNFLSDLRPSLLKYLLVEEGEIWFRKSRVLYSFLPLAGLIIGSIAAFEIMKSGGILTTGLGIFLAVTILSIIDPISGLAAVIAFFTVELVAGNVFSVRDVLLVGSISFAWIAPALFAALIRRVTTLEFSRFNESSALIRLLSTFFSAAIGTLAFYFGYLLVDSILYEESEFQRLSIIQCGIVFLAIALRTFVAMTIEAKPAIADIEISQFHLVRVNSPITSVIVNLLIFAFVYIWTQSAQKSLIVSALFAIPYYLIFIGMGSTKFGFLTRVPRSFIVEPIVIAAICWLIFRQISSLPLLSTDASYWLLFLASIPLIVHAEISAIWPNVEKKETISL